MSSLVGYIGLGLLLGVLGFLLKELGFRGAPLLGVLGISLLFIFLVSRMGSVLAGLDGIINTAGISELATAALKIIGVGYTTGISADICKEIGEVGIARALESLGKVEILAVSMPYIVRIVGLVTGELL